MRGANHPQYRHGHETLEAKAERSQRLSELREVEALAFALGIAEGARWRGRKPLTKHPNHPHNSAETDPLITCGIE
jgi:hypothetical protein